jgi:hypothetical protein
MRSVVFASLLLMTALAGCISMEDSGSGDSADDRWGPAIRPSLPTDALPHGDGHDHGDPAEHRFLWNYDFANRDPMESDMLRVAGLHALKIADDHLFGAVYGHHAVSANGGLVIWDLADPAQPERVGHFRVPGHVGGDRSIGVTPDGDFAVIGAEPLTCFGHVNPVPFDAYLIDTRDKSNPVLADAVSLLGPSLGTHELNERQGTHAVWVHNFDGEDYAFIWGDIYKIERDGPTGAVLVDTGASIRVGHDIYIRETPWGDTWALAANGFSDFRLYNLNDPTNPVLIAIFEEDDGHYIHTADVAFLEDGHIVIVVTSEDWGDHESPMWIFDATHLRDHDGSEGDPEVLYAEKVWTNPSDRTAVNMHFSLHNPRFHDDGILTLSHYHGGLWQMDFRHPEFRTDPAIIAYAVYADDDPPLMMDPVQNLIESQLCGLGLGLDTPMYTDVEIGPGGILYAADPFMGLYTFTPTADHPVFGQDSS